MAVTAHIQHKAKKFIKPAAGLVTAVVAVTTMLNTAPAKLGATGTSAAWTSKAAYVTSRIIGPQATYNLFNSSGTYVPYVTGTGGNSPFLPAAGVSWTGPLNVNTFTGIGVLILNYVIKMFDVPYYSAYASPFINALGVGLLVGGVIGGLLDPPGPATATTRTGYGAGQVGLSTAGRASPAFGSLDAGVFGSR